MYARTVSSPDASANQMAMTWYAINIRRFAAALSAGMLLSGVSYPALAADPAASRYYEDALVRFEKQDVEGAIIQLKNALQIDRNMLPAHMLLGKALLSKGDVASAEVTLREALRLGVNRAEVIVPLAQTVIAQGKQKSLFDRPEFGLSGLPDATRIQLLLIRSSASADLGDIGGALQAIVDARAIDPGALAPWLAEIPTRIRAGQRREAEHAVDQALALAPNSAEAWYQKGAVHHVSGGLREAVAAYDRALAADGKHVEALIARSGLHLDLGNLREATADAEQLRKLAPKDPRVVYLRALLADREKKHQEVETAFRELTALIDPVPMNFVRYRPQLLLLNGLAHHGLNEREKARSYLQAFQQVQSNTAASKLLAQLYFDDGKTDRAIEVLDGYLKANIGDGQAMMLLASALMAKGRHAQATSLMQRAVQSQDAPEYRTVLGMSLLGGGHINSAVEELETTLKLYPGATQAAALLASVYLQSGKAAKAIPVVDKLVKQQPGNAEFVNLLGKAKGQTGDLAGARAAFEQAARMDDKLVSARINLVRLDIAGKAFDAARARLNEILKHNNKHVEAMSLMGLLFERQGRLGESEQWLKRANDHAAAKDGQWGLLLVDFYLRHGRTEPALELAKRLYGKALGDARVSMAYARAQLASGDRVGAKSSLAAANVEAGYDPALQVQIAGLQLAANNPDGAIFSLEKVFSIEPGHLPAMAMMTQVELRQGELDKAEMRARDIVKTAPKHAVGYQLQGDVALARGKTGPALEAYRQAHQLEPTVDSLLRVFGLLVARRDENAAMHLAEQWLKTHPDDWRVAMALADALARTGNYPAARKAYLSLAAALPDDGAVLNNLANVLQRLKDPGALQVAELAVAKSPGNPNALDTLGWLLFQAGQYDRALLLLRDARLRQPENPEIRYHLAAILVRTGRKSEAREELEAAMKSGQAFEGEDKAAALLKGL